VEDDFQKNPQTTQAKHTSGKSLTGFLTSFRPVKQRKIDTTLASRYEMKYLISEAKATAIERFVFDYLPITQDLATILAGRYMPPQKNHSKEIEALRQFLLYYNSINAGPVILVRYMRKAYEGTSDNRVRVTFDTNLCFNTSTTAEVLLGGSGWQKNNVSLHGVILEIKFTGRFPAWLNRMTRYFGLRQRSMSKYTTSVQNACRLGFCAPKINGMNIAEINKI